MTTQRTILLAFAAIVLVGAIYFATKKSTPPAAASTIVWTDFTKGRTAAQAANKKLLIDVYTDWCTWCKTMDKSTYGDAEVAAYVQANFVPVKLNAESQEMRQISSKNLTDAELASAYGVSGYPTTVFANSDGTPITSMDGYIKAADFKTVLRFIAEDRYRAMSFEEYKNSIH